MVYGLFRDPDKKYGKLEEIVIDIEKYSHELDWSHCTIQSIIWNLENPKIDKETLNFFEKNPPDAIFIYSSKSAKNLFNLINKYSLLNVVTQSNLMCISEKVLLILKQIKWKKVFVFSPGEEEFLLKKIR